MIIEDYGKGVINPALLEEAVDLCKKRNKIITVDPKEEHLDYYENVTSLTPNLKEAETAGGMKIKDKKEIASVASIAANNDSAIGELISEAMDKVGKSGLTHAHHIAMITKNR